MSPANQDTRPSKIHATASLFYTHCMKDHFESTWEMSQPGQVKSHVDLGPRTHGNVFLRFLYCFK